MSCHCEPESVNFSIMKIFECLTLTQSWKTLETPSKNDISSSLHQNIYPHYFIIFISHQCATSTTTESITHYNKSVHRNLWFAARTTICAAIIEDQSTPSDQSQMRFATVQNVENHTVAVYFSSTGTVMTPNYLRSPKISVSPFCDCSNSGNSKEDCERFTEFFTDNACLRE